MENRDFKELLAQVSSKLGYGTANDLQLGSVANISSTGLQTLVPQLFEYVCEQCNMLQKERKLGYSIESVINSSMPLAEKDAHLQKLNLLEASIYDKAESAAFNLIDAFRQLLRVVANSQGAISFASLDESNSKLLGSGVDKLHEIFAKTGFPKEQIDWLCQNSMPIGHHVLQALFPRGVADIEFFLDHVFVKGSGVDWLKIGFPNCSQQDLNEHPEFFQRLANLIGAQGVIPNIFMLISYSHLIVEELERQLAGSNTEAQ